MRGVASAKIYGHFECSCYMRECRNFEKVLNFSMRVEFHKVQVAC